MAASFTPGADTIARDAMVEPYLTAGLGVRRDLDAVAQLAADLCSARHALIGLLWQGQCVVLGQAGQDAGRLEALPAIWAQTLASEGGQAADAACDAALAANPLLVGDRAAGFYAGQPLVGEGGMALGCLCVIDDQPRAGRPAGLQRHLQTLASAAMRCLEEARHKSADLHAAPLPGEQAPLAHEGGPMAALLPHLIWSASPEGDVAYHSPQWEAFTGAAAAEGHGDNWLAFVHPQDRAAVRAGWQMAVETGQPYVAEYRLQRHSGEYCWMLARAAPAFTAEGAVAFWIGTCTAIQERVETAVALAAMARELSHRVKNLFAVLQSIVSMALRPYPEMAAVSRTLQSRMVTLAAVYDLVRPRVVDGRAAHGHTTLHKLAAHVFTLLQGTGTVRLAVEGEDVPIDDPASTPLAIFLHEMTTNSLQHGALSAPEGRVRFRVGCEENSILLHWSEHGGPAIHAEPAHNFGLRLVHLMVQRQLGGTLAWDWKHGGLMVEARLPASRLCPQPDRVRAV